jgi:hypothetical protein
MGKTSRNSKATPTGGSKNSTPANKLTSNPNRRTTALQTQTKPTDKHCTAEQKSLQNAQPKKPSFTKTNNPNGIKKIGTNPDNPKTQDRKPTNSGNQSPQTPNQGSGTKFSNVKSKSPLYPISGFQHRHPAKTPPKGRLPEPEVINDTRDPDYSRSGRSPKAPLTPERL